MSTERWRLVYVGLEFSPHTRDRSYTYQRILDGDRLASAIRFKKALLPANPGTVLEVDVELDGDPPVISVHGKGRAYAGRHWRDVDSPLVRVWAATDRAARSEVEAASKSRIDEFAENLRPLRIAYWSLPAPQRAILLAQVVRYIAGGAN